MSLEQVQEIYRSIWSNGVIHPEEAVLQAAIDETERARGR